jgi:hypothetical protein
MARIVRHEKNSPYEVAEGTELPTRDENPADVYLYDDASRVRVKNEY